MRDKIDVVIVAYGAGEFLARMELAIWDDLSTSQRAALRNDPKYTHMGRPSCSRA